MGDGKAKGTPPGSGSLHRRKNCANTAWHGSARMNSRSVPAEPAQTKSVGAAPVNRALLELDLGARVLELLLHFVRVGLGHAFLDGLRRAFDEILGFLQAEARDLADDLDDGDLVAAGFLELDVELGLLLDSRGRRGSAGSR